MPSFELPMVGLAAYSGTGKTTLLTKLISIFRRNGLRIGVIKHAHHTFEIDYPGKDSYEIRKAGASQVLIGSKKRWAIIVDHEDDNELKFEDHLRHFDQDNLDLLLVEGFKPEAIPSIELNRKALNKPYIFPQDKSIIAIATDDPQNIIAQLPVLDLNQPEQIATFIIDRFLNDHKIASHVTK